VYDLSKKKFTLAAGSDLDPIDIIDSSDLIDRGHFRHTESERCAQG